MKRFLVLAGILVGVSAFFYFRAQLPEVPVSFDSVLPGRDEVCSSGKIRLTMNSYEALLARFPEISPLDRVRVGLYGQWLKETRAQDPRSLKDAVRCVRALMNPPVNASETKETEELLLNRFGISSLKELTIQIDNAWRDRPIEWNHSLVKEYRIEVSETLGNSG